MENRKYCDDHTCYHNSDGVCPKCERGEPCYVRERSEVPESETERIADLERRGLIEPKIEEPWETKEQKEARLKKRNEDLAELDRKHKKTTRLIEEGKWDDLAEHEESENLKGGENNNGKH